MTGERGIAAADGERLVRLARETIAHALHRGPAPELPRGGVFDEPRGAFVTLERGGRLRGCIGRIVSPAPLAETVRDMALAAAFEDPRFPPLEGDEFDDIDVEVSVLTPPAPIDPADVEPGRHGLIVERGLQRGLLLPQVATDHGWDRETFLDQTCVKAGLAPGDWRRPDTRVLAFEAEVFGERRG